MAKKYDESSIEVLEYPENVQNKPEYYLGCSIGPMAIFQALKEPTDNSTDEGINGHGSIVGIGIGSDGFIVWDHGRGIPVGPHSKFKNKSTLEVVMTTLHAGGKLTHQQDGYKVSQGTFGLGVSVTNALSEKMDVWTFREKHWYHQSYKRGIPTSKVTKQNPPKLKNGPVNHTHGTIVRFVPDKKIFGEHQINIKHLKEWLNISAYIRPTIKFILKTTEEKEVYSHPEGLAGYIEYIAEKAKSEIYYKTFVYQSDGLDVSLAWSSFHDERVLSYVNGSPTADGGSHIDGVFKAITEALAPFKGARAKYKSEDLRSGLLGIINIKLKSPKFSSQSKSKLADGTVATGVLAQIKPELTKYLNGNKTFAKEIIQRAVIVSDAMQKLKMSKKAASKLKTTKAGKTFISSNLLSASTRDFKKVELFLVEGKSAGGSAGKARNSEFQAVLPLRGKILNVDKDMKGKSYENKEIIDILRVTGYDPSQENPMKNLRFGKLIILTDADPDGGHISILLTSVYEKMMPGLIDKGMVYYMDMALFKAQLGPRNIYGKTLEDLLSKLPKNFNRNNITRMKGLGEAPDDVMKEIAMNKKTRKLVRLMPLTKTERLEMLQITTSPEAKRDLLSITSGKGKVLKVDTQ